MSESVIDDDSATAPPATPAAPIRLLLIEDSEADAELLVLEIERSGLACLPHRVETREGVIAALDAERWDLIVCDNNLPRFSATEALSLWRARRESMPLIVVTGEIGEEAAVEMMRGGAADVILKSSLGRVAPRIRRVLAEAEAHEARDAAERAQRQSQVRYRQIVDTAHDGILTLDAHSRISFVNARLCQITGYAVEELVGQRGLTFLDADAARIARDKLNQHRLGQTDRYELSLRRKDGTPVAATISSSPLHDDSGQFAGMLVMVADETDRREAEERLRHAQKMEAIGQLTGGIAHDFNNLLTVIIGNLDALDAHVRDDTLRKRLAAARRGARRGADLTMSLLAYGRRQVLQPRVLSLNDFVQQTMSLLARTLGEHVETATVLQPKLHLTRIDPSQFESALINLAVNARDAMPDGGKLTIETANAVLDAAYAARHQEVTPGEYAMVAVTDSGTGIPPDVVQRVFEPFFTTKTGGKGTGLGLSMVYGFVKQSNGHIKIYSEPGLGTTVRLYFPRSRDARDEAADGEVANEAARGSETVLVVEDDEDVRDTSVFQLEGHGYRVLQADSARVALDILGRGTPIDLVISDLVMPGGMSGADLAKAIAERFADVKVLLVSGYAEAALGRNGDIVEGARFLAKPFDKDALLHAVRAALDG